VREKARKDVSFPVVLQNPDAYVGTTVIWGGIIIDTENHSQGAILTVLETPLNYEEMPKDGDFSRGRFLARVPKYLDPEIYHNGRKITLAGEVAGKDVQPVGSIDYRYPIVQVKELHLWRTVVRYSPPYYPYWGYYGWPYWYGPRYHFHFRYRH
jgi:outer membrane lipoprotein